MELVGLILLMVISFWSLRSNIHPDLKSLGSSLELREAKVNDPLVYKALETIGSVLSVKQAAGYSQSLKSLLLIVLLIGAMLGEAY